MDRHMVVVLVVLLVLVTGLIGLGVYLIEKCEDKQACAQAAAIGIAVGAVAAGGRSK